MKKFLVFGSVCFIVCYIMKVLLGFWLLFLVRSQYTTGAPVVNNNTKCFKRNISLNVSKPFELSKNSILELENEKITEQKCSQKLSSSEIGTSITNEENIYIKNNLVTESNKINESTVNYLPINLNNLEISTPMEQFNFDELKSNEIITSDNSEQNLTTVNKDIYKNHQDITERPIESKITKFVDKIHQNTTPTILIIGNKNNIIDPLLKSKFHLIAEELMNDSSEFSSSQGSNEDVSVSIFNSKELKKKTNVKKLLKNFKRDTGGSLKESFGNQELFPLAGNENSVEKAERVAKSLEHIFQFVSVLGQFDSYLSNRLRTFAKKVTSLYLDDEN